MARYQGGKNEAGQPHGFGKKSWADGIEYTGSWQDGLKHGDSETVWPDGTIYRGSYTHGKKHGPFVVSRKDGVVFIGTYANGQRVGQGVHEGRTHEGRVGNERERAAADARKRREQL